MLHSSDAGHSRHIFFSFFIFIFYSLFLFYLKQHAHFRKKVLDRNSITNFVNQMTNQNK